MDTVFDVAIDYDRSRLLSLSNPSQKPNILASCELGEARRALSQGMPARYPIESKVQKQYCII